MKQLKTAMYVLIFLLVYILLHIYFAYAVNEFLQVSGFPDLFIPLIILFTAFGFLFPFGQMIRSLRILKTVGALWFAFIQFALIVFPILHIGVILSSMIFLERQIALLSAGTIAGLLLMIFLIRGMYQAYSPVMTSYQIQLNHQQKNQDDLNVALVTDTHFGPLAGARSAKKLTDMLIHTQPDLILFAGDVVDDDPVYFTEHHLSQYFKRLRPPMGMFGVLGNHEYYGGKRDEIVQMLEDTGIQMLLDDQVVLNDRLILIGRKDRTDKHRKSVHELMAQVTDEEEYPVLMMDHQPGDLKIMTEYPVDMSVSGHTHKGQIWPNQLFTRRLFPLDYGYRQFGSLHSIVSSGFGFWGPPIRIGSRAELVLINVTFSTPLEKRT